jgi:cyclopropane fatty-acyl-phospholipid synthase-like methyltransferase
MPTNSWYQHDLNTVRDMLCTCIGPKWGDAPEEKIAEIRQSRYAFGKRLCRKLNINDNDTVLDFGSGCGFVSRAFCEHAKTVHCADLNPAFLDFTRKELSMFPATQYHHITYASIPDLPNESIDTIASTAVFIHFLYYDVLYNLIELNRVLKPQGILYFDILDADAIDLSNPAAISNHIEIYKDSVRGDGFMLQPFSLSALKQLATQLGYELIDTEHIGAGNNVAEVILRKVSKPKLPEWLKQSI